MHQPWHRLMIGGRGGEEVGEGSEVRALFDGDEIADFDSTKPAVKLLLW